MNKTYVIQWKSRVNGRTGRGTKLFDREEANRLAQELNREYPQIEHEVLDTLHSAAPGDHATLAESADGQDSLSRAPIQALAA